MTKVRGRKVLIRRLRPGIWMVVRPMYGFSDCPYQVTVYRTWIDAVRSVVAVSLGGAGTFDRSTKEGARKVSV